MANSRVFNLSINGVQHSINNIGQLQSTVQQLEQQLNGAQFGTQQFDQLQQDLQAARRALAQFQQQSQNVQNGANQAGQNAQQMGSQFQDAFGIASLAAGDTGNALQALQGGFNSVQGGIGTVVKGFSTLKGAIASTGIGLLVLALGALVTYFGKSQDAMNFLERKTKALQAVFNVLTNVVAKVGESLFKALQNPKKALQDFVDFLQTNLTNRLKSFAVILEAIQKGDFRKLTDGVAQLTLGITDATTKLKQFGKEVTAAAAQAEKIALSNQKIAAQERALNVERAEARARIEALKKASDDVTKSNAARTAAARQAAAIENDLIQKQLALTDQKIKNLRAEQKLKGNITNDDLDALAELRKQRAEVQQESLTLQTELQNKVNGLRQEQKAKDEADAAARKAAAEKAAEETKARLEKEAADTQAASVLNFAIRKSSLERELTLVEENSTDALAIRKRQAALETETVLAGIREKYEKAGPKEKEALMAQLQEVQAVGEETQKRIDAEFTQKRQVKAAQDEADLAGVKLLGLKEGSKAYLEALLEQVDAEERLALAQLKDTKENEAQRTKIIAEAAQKRKDLTVQIAKAPVDDVGTSILKNLLGVKEDDVADVKALIDQSAQYAQEVTLQLINTMAQARMKALDAQVQESQSIIDAAKQASEDLKAELDASQSRIDDLESRLLTAKGAERDRIIKQLEVERQRNAAIAQDKAREDARQRKAEQDKITLEQKRTQEQEKQQRIQQQINALSAVGAAISATKAAVDSVSAVAKAGQGGKFGFDNIAYIVAATAAMVAAGVAVKNAVKGFDEGGFTGSGFGTPDKSGYRVAGVVHEGEWVAPKWMVTSPAFSHTIGHLEAARTGSYAVGGYAPVSVPAPQQGVDMSVLVSMQQNIQTLQAQTAQAIQKPIFVRPSDVVSYQEQRTEITDHYLN